ncbi:astacin-like [Styela clava]
MLKFAFILIVGACAVSAVRIPRTPSKTCGVQNVAVECPGTKCIERLLDSYGCLTCACNPNPTRMDDMILSPTVARFIDAGFRPGRPSKGASISFPLWNNIPSGTTYLIPYEFASGFASAGQTAVQQSIVDLEASTCLRFIPRTSQSDYMQFYADSGCFAPIGRNTGINRISLGDGCQTKGIAIHEIMHSLGFFHEHQRPDRDAYVNIILTNVEPGKEGNFEKISTIDSLGSPYDYTSIMHYFGTAFSKDDTSKTITMPDGTDLVGYQEAGLVQTDIDQINLLYKCSAITTTTTTVSPTTVPNPTCADKLTECQYWAATGRCSSAGYIRMMRKKCQKSCGYCTASGTLACFDLSGNACATLKRLCKATVVVRNICKRTCGQCT